MFNFSIIFSVENVLTIKRTVIFHLFSMRLKVCFENLLNSFLRPFQTALTSTTDTSRGSGAGTGDAHHVDCPVSLLSNMVLLY